MAKYVSLQGGGVGHKGHNSAAGGKADKVQPGSGAAHGACLQCPAGGAMR